MKVKDILFLATISFSACMTAKVSTLPKSAGDVDFDNLASVNNTSTPFWTSKASSEYYLELPVTNDTVIFNAILKSFRDNGYAKGQFNVLNHSYIAERGMRANEWKTVTGAYYKINQTNIQLYVISVIRQDITGGWRENRAKKVALKIEANVKSEKL